MPPVVSPRVPLSLFGIALAMGVGVVACTFLVNADATQCTSDADCARFGTAICNLSTHLCRASDLVTPDAGGSADGDDPLGVDGPAALCFSFDNKTRLANLSPDGGLLPLPAEVP